MGNESLQTSIPTGFSVKLDQSCALAVFDIMFPSLKWSPGSNNSLLKVGFKLHNPLNMRASGSMKGMCIFLSGRAIMFNHKCHWEYLEAFVLHFPRMSCKSLRHLVFNSNQSLVYSLNQLHHKVPSWIILREITTVKPQASSEIPIATVPRPLKIHIFEDTTLLKGLTVLFQDSDPSLDMMQTIYQLMILSGSVRKADKQNLYSCIETNSKNVKFLTTFGKCFIKQMFDRQRWCFNLNL